MILALDISLPDPFGAFFNGTVPTLWHGTLADMTRDLYLGLFTLELIVLAVQALLFKDSVADYFRSLGSKVLLATLAIAVIGNAPSLFPAVINLFADTATSTVACPTGSQGCLSNANAANVQLSDACKKHLKYACVPPRPSTDLEATFLGWAVTYFLAADASRVADAAESVASGILTGTPFPPDPGNGTVGLPLAFLMGHVQFQLACMALGMICVTAAGALLLTYLLLTFEAQIVLAIGVLCLAGFGNRFTTPFAQAFPRYCVTLGVKFFAFYFVVAAIGAICNGVDFGSMLGGLLSGAGVPFGAGAVVLLMTTTPAPIVAMISAVMIYAIPQFAASLLRGSPALSASAVYGQFASEFERAKTMNG